MRNQAVYYTIYKLESLHGPCQQAVGRLYIKVTVCQFGTRLQLALASQMPATVNHGAIFPQYVMQNARSCLGSLGLLVLLLLLTHSLHVTGCKRKARDMCIHIFSARFPLQITD